ncbi:MAG: hypothetical protein H8Z69_04380 [Nanohaloarchaea archaeon]|nr:hypothetical protein [Candidatus Nanohaloarchaea archaeon]
MDLQRMTENYRVHQEEQGQTAGIVLETAERALETEGYFRSSIVHDEPAHWNLSYVSQPIPRVPEERQERRLSGGGELLHENSLCAMKAIETPSSKQRVDYERNSFAAEFLEALEQAGEYEKTGVLVDGEVKGVDASDTVAYFAPKEGDIYVSQNGEPNPLTDPQLVGLGLPDIDLKDGNVVVGRACMYEDLPESRHLYPENVRNFKDWESYLDGIEPVENSREVLELLEGTDSTTLKAEEFAEYSILRAERLMEQREEELRNGKGRPAYPCF